MTQRMEAHFVWRARSIVRGAAMMLARAGVPDDTIREALRELAEEEAEVAINWGREEDRRQALADAEPAEETR